jgi:hypothetical protein
MIQPHANERKDPPVFDRAGLLVVAPGMAIPSGICKAR